MNGRVWIRIPVHDILPRLSCLLWDFFANIVLVSIKNNIEECLWDITLDPMFGKSFTISLSVLVIVISGGIG